MNKAEQLYQQVRALAEQGHADAQYNLGWCYYYGEGVKPSDAQAFYWYKKAAEQDHADAQYNMGWCYIYGQGVSRDLAQARYWYEKAAAQGHQDAIDLLKNMK